MRWKRLNLPIGFKSYMLEVVEELEDKKGRSNYLCKCTCGNVVEVLGKFLVNQNNKSCGCLRRLIASAHSLTDEIDITGKRFDRLLVLGRDFSIREKKDYENTTYWLCKCDCGKIVTRRKISLQDKKRIDKGKSCGCRERKGRNSI